MTEEASVLGYPEHPGKAAWFVSTLCHTGEKGKCMNQSDVLSRNGIVTLSTTFFLVDGSNVTVSF